MKAVFWGYRFSDMKESWRPQAQWLAEALYEEGHEIVQHRSFVCALPHARPYDPALDNPCDLVIYNHADISHLMGNIVKAGRTWFLKPTVPDEVHSTLDPLGFGPYSSIAYERPDFENIHADEIAAFFTQKVSRWITNRITKWGSFDPAKEDIAAEDYYLVIGQCGGDETVTRHDFGSHFLKLEQVVRELVHIGDRPVIVKLHPYTDGKDAKNNDFSLSLKQKIEAISPKVRVFNGKTSVHDFINYARCVILANSGAGFEAMMHHKPIIAWGFSEYHWVAYDLRHLADLTRATKLDWFDAGRQDKFLYWYMERYCFYDLPTAKRRVKELLQ